MSPHEIAHQIPALATAEHVDEQSTALVKEWTSAGAGLEVVEPILRFMETHGDLDYGPPGALVHFVERFYRQGYEELLLASVERRPTPHTVWMLNRLVNGPSAPETRSAYTSALARAVASRRRRIHVEGHRPVLGTSIGAIVFLHAWP